MANKDSSSVKREIINAFLQLMEEKSYMDITVTDIINTAEVARASFYRNFSSISDVIDTIVEEMSDELITDIFPTLFSSDERKWREFLFEHFYRFAKMQRQMGSLHFQNMSVIFSRMDQRMNQKEASLPQITMRDKYLSAGKMGLINNITKKWMDNGMNETPEEMIDYIMTFITSF